MKTFSSCRLF